MKTKLFIVCALLISSVVLFFSCDKVDAPYMVVTDVSDCPVPVFPDIATPEKTLLIEEFTGHKCVYCPTGAHYIHLIQQQAYGSRVVALAIHSGGLSEPEPGNYDLDLRPGTFGEELYAYFGSPSQPRAGFNREKLDGSNVFYGTPATWQTKAEQVLAQSPVMTLQIINNYDSASRKLCSHVKSKFLSANTQNLKIALFVSEDSITGYQLNNNNTVGTTPEIENYVFMDVMRDAFVGSFGEVLTSGGVAMDSAVVRTYKKILDPAWNDKHCKVVAYVYDTDNGVILQAAEEKVY
ncbi:MAG TPA: Omp28-related outer membrane protein [Bacteroidales bacterium]|nr:Omp28-related outer membrane protein [Bacteroidales bacterium]HNZ43864.1 Omp28-related outer membrane protein [Bacteroidales bacterium]HPB26395.1 Omp28-related outer membrane protein [Bacteroidales bacterium]HQN16884.1 Omp28-related outer membrane protein [Bacteroidales bacterium]HQP16316.1 Omp28-related outer membrane protein [Bacteroidales bacterium]